MRIIQPTFHDYLGNGDDDGETHMSSRKSELIYGTFNEAMYALIMKFNEINKRQ